MAPLRLVRGIYVPTPTFFKDDEAQSLDIPAHEEHILWLAKAGVQGILIQGSTAEAVALTPTERIEITEATRAVLDKNGFEHVLVLAGAGAQSVHEAVSLATDAKNAGADHVLVLPPAYFASSLTADDVVKYYTKVADKSPLPVLIYSYPGVSSGLVISSDTFAILGKHPNIVGCKQTDHLVGKMACNAYNLRNENFLVLGGGSDYLIGALAVGAAGAITGMANIAPRAVLKLVKFWEEGKVNEALELQGKIAIAETAIVVGGVPAFKAICGVLLGRGGIPRHPVPPTDPKLLEYIQSTVAPAYEFEQRLWAEAAQSS